jgi:hypothetical protein
MDKDEVEVRKASPGGREPQDISSYKEILRDYRQRLIQDPRNVSLLNEVGRAAENAGDINRAFWAYKRAIRLDPGYAESYRNLSLLYQQEGREEQAEHALQKYGQLGGKVAGLPPVRQKTVQAHDKHRTVQVREGNGVGTARDRPGAVPSPSVADSPIYARLNQVWDEMGLTPAEAMLLLDPAKSNGLKMMQYTLLDLVARGVLEADSRLRIGRGEAFGKSDLAPHEAIFAKYFSRISDYVDLDKLALAALAELDDDGDAYKAAYVRVSLLRKGFMELGTKRVAGVLPVRTAVLSRKGTVARTRLQRLLSEADRQLARSLADNPQQANAYVDKGGPALLLMDEYPSRQFKRWNEMLTRMGFGPAIEKLKGRARKSTLGGYVEDLLRVLSDN